MGSKSCRVCIRGESKLPSVRYHFLGFYGPDLIFRYSQERRIEAMPLIRIVGEKLTSSGLLLGLLLGLVGKALAHEGDVVLNFHGSGTTNPSKCYWTIIEQFEARTKHPIRGTYRGIGSTTGIEEFYNNNNPLAPAADFGSGDIPLNKTVYDSFASQGIGIVQLPVMLGAVSFFHSVPASKLNLTSCLLARIFGREITHWGHQDIVALNPEIADISVPITVARRVKGSSSTDAVTNVSGLFLLIALCARLVFLFCVTSFFGIIVVHAPVLPRPLAGGINWTSNYLARGHT